jgi:LysM repeat protein
MRSYRGTLALLPAVAALGVTSCSGDDPAGGGPTLPPIRTTMPALTTVPTMTTLPQYYEVQRGDTLTLIAAAYQIPVQALMDANQLTNPDDIFAGQFLAIPRREDIVAVSLPPTVPGQTPPPMPTVAGATTAPLGTVATTSAP